ncbi:g3336 [Coccomyxa elongata]
MIRVDGWGFANGPPANGGPEVLGKPFPEAVRTRAHLLLPEPSTWYAGADGFIIVSANATTFQSDFFTLGSLFSQCTITAFADKTKAPIVSVNCKLGLTNA